MYSQRNDIYPIIKIGNCINKINKLWKIIQQATYDMETANLWICPYRYKQPESILIGFSTAFAVVQIKEIMLQYFRYTIQQICIYAFSPENIIHICPLVA